MPGYRLGLIMATMLEAEALIKDLGLQPQPAGPFRTYDNSNIILVICGIGKAAAAAATAWLITRDDPDMLINLGAAGALCLDLPLGKILTVRRVVEPDRLNLETGGPREGLAQTAGSFDQAVLATMDSPARSEAERAAIAGLADLIDMEGAAVLQTAALFGKECRLLKFVSDTPENHAIRENIARLRDEFSSTIKDFLLQISA